MKPFEETLRLLRESLEALKTEVDIMEIDNKTLKLALEWCQQREDKGRDVSNHLRMLVNDLVVLADTCPARGCMCSCYRCRKVIEARNYAS